MIANFLQVLQHWQAVQKDAADARLLRELQLTHQASLHHRKMFGLRSLHGWALAAAASREDAAAQARRDASWGKVQQWLAEDTSGQASSEAIMAPPFLQVTCCIVEVQVTEAGRCKPHCVVDCMPHLVLLTVFCMLVPCRTFQVQCRHQIHCLLVWSKCY